MMVNTHVQHAFKQNGAALIVSLLILSIVVVLVATMTVEHNFHIRRTSNQLTASQAESYLRATEAIAHKALELDSQLDQENGASVDHLAEFWAQETPPFILDNGAYTGRLYDLQGRFNINSLLLPQANQGQSTNQGQRAVPFTWQQGVFIRLLQSFNNDQQSISYDQAVSITESVLDYIDQDQNTRGFDCGEDDAYYAIAGRSPHRTANQALVSVSELRLICNLPVSLFRKLQPHLTVWPATGDTAINLNTASVELLSALIIADNDQTALQNLTPGYSVPAPIDQAELNTLLERQQSGYDDFSSLINDLNGLVLWPGAEMSLASDYFLLASDVQLDDVVMHLDSVISRKDGTIKILARSTDGL